MQNEINRRHEAENQIRKERGMQIAQTCRIMHREKGGRRKIEGFMN